MDIIKRAVKERPVEVTVVITTDLPIGRIKKQPLWLKVGSEYHKVSCLKSKIYREEGNKDGRRVSNLRKGKNVS